MRHAPCENKEALDLANHPSALKRARQNEKRRLRNKSYKTRVKTTVKQLDSAVANKDQDQAAATLRQAVAIIQKTASRGVIHRRKAARRVSRLARRVNQLTAS